MHADEARFLTSDEGARLLESARATRALAAHHRVERLGATVHADRVRALLSQDDLRRRALPRCPHAERLLFTREALEQASAWPVAAERAGRWPGPPDTPLFDLGAGIGLDTLAAAAAGRPVTAVERDPARVLLLAFNVRALGFEDRVRVLEADVETTRGSGPLALLDPGRRPGGRRTREAEAFEPPRSRWGPILEGFAAAMIKLPPSAGPAGMGPFEVVSLDGRARECRLFLGDFSHVPPRRALSLPSGHAVAGAGAPWPAARPPRVGDWLLDPDPAVTLAGLVGDLALGLGMAPIHPRIAYLLGSERPHDAPGRVLRIDALLRPRAREVNAWLKARRVGRFTVKTRGVADDAAAWRRRLRPGGGDAEATLAFTRTPDDRWIGLGSLMTSE